VRRQPFARGDGYLPLRKAIKGAILAPKLVRQKPAAGDALPPLNRHTGQAPPR